MSDEPSVAVETTIKVDAERVYELMADLDAMASYGTEFQSGEWASGRPGTVGATFRGRNRIGEREWETVSTIVTAKPGRELAWMVGDVENSTATWTVTLRSVPDGTEVHFGFVHGPGPSGLRDRIEAQPDDEERYIDSRLEMIQQNMIKTLEGIRRRTAR
ncbi:MAG: hypothetical protein ACI81L_000918 [Verrucomicrobiales bacterium]|jgi:hypothetical protein